MKSSQVKTADLTPRQFQLLEAIAGFQSSQPYSATIRQLASKMQISRTTAFEHLAALREKDLVWGCPNKARSLKLTSQGQRLLKNRRAQKSTQILAEDTGDLPLLGRVAAGRPIDAIEDKQSLSLASHFGSTDQIFALEVVGESMINDGINSGDYVICRKSPVARNGQLVVAIIDDETTTLKRFYKEPTRARLEPANENYAPIYSDNCRIEAVVVGLIRKF